MKGLVLFCLFLLSSAKAFKVAIGSCHNMKRVKKPSDSLIWKKISARSPDAFIWGGDVIYADQIDYSELLTNRKHFAPATPETLRKKYAEMENYPAYQNFIKEIGQVNIYGIWDDHDMGLNDAGKDYPYREESQQAFLDFLKVSQDSPRRLQRGIYEAFTLDNDRIKVILLDNRYHKDHYKKKNGDFLGEEQWLWLEKELNDMPKNVKVTLIVSGIQVLPDDLIRSRCCETWHRHPKARQRLIKLVSNSKAASPIFLSGDVHYAEMTQAICYNDSGDSFALPEMTTSGLTHSWQDYPFAATLGMNIVQIFAKSPYQVKGQYFLDRNFGEVSITNNSVSLAVFNKDGSKVLEQSFFFTDLKSRNMKATSCKPIRSHHLIRKYMGTFVAVVVLIGLFLVLPYYIIRLVF